MASSSAPSQAPPQVQSVTFQGIEVPSSAVNPQAFFELTRRQNVPVKSIASFAGLGSTDTVSMLRTGILSKINVQVAGSATITPGTGTAATTWRWPYGLLQAARFSANGMSNLVNADGWWLRTREFFQRGRVSDRGVSQSVNGATVTQGTLAKACESWGLGQAESSLTSGTYDFQFGFTIPVAYDTTTLMGAIFAQTTSTSLELDLQWATLANLFTLTGNATATVAAAVTVEAEFFSIPSDGQGGIFIPDLSAFHSYVENVVQNGVGVGPNTFDLAGQGVGRQLMRLGYRIWNDSAPLPVGDQTNIGWLYGGNTQPETFATDQRLRALNEESYDTDLAGRQGIYVIDFDREWAFRDAVDEGSATELRFTTTVANGVTISSPSVEYVQDVVFAGVPA